MSAREAVRKLEKAGAKLVRKKGDHYMFKMRDGSVVSVPMGGRQSEVSPGLQARIRRALNGRLLASLPGRENPESILAV